MTKDTDRHSEPVLTPEHKQLSPAERAPIEAANGLRQFDRLIKILDAYLEGTRQGRDHFVVRPSMLMELNRFAVDQLIANPGAYRQTPMTIRTAKGEAKHTPPRWEDVPELVDEMCDYVNRNSNQSAFHLAAYLLWRVNWIHPFTDGNGRTARAISYLVLCVRMHQRLPGDRTIPDFISDEKSTYYTGLEAADEAYAKGRVDVSALEAYLRELLVEQVTRAASATDGSAPTVSMPPPKRDVDAVVEALGAFAANSGGTRWGPWIAAIAAILVALITGGFAISRCGKDARCVAAAQQPCKCRGGLSGIQTCNEDGLKFSDCDCVLTAPLINASPTDSSVVDAPSLDATTIDARTTDASAP